LPEAQLDRFMLKVVINYPSFEEEQQIMRLNMAETFEKVNPVLQTSTLLRARSVVREVYMDEKIERYILSIVFATRTPQNYGLGKLQPLISYGGSPRASISLALAARALAFLNKRGYVIPDDIRAVCHDVLRHRIGVTYEAEAENISSEQIITEVLNTIEVA
ncbi:MAG TPA: MoxR family ATPase, partial [Chitinophagales bacterium]|nr:MoxR family ATPase [Chitinophagales bacterium]